jgi:hypothetical protein
MHEHAMLKQTGSKNRAKQTVAQDARGTGGSV